MTQLQGEIVFQLKNQDRIALQRKIKSIKLLHQSLFQSHPWMKKLTASNNRQKMRSSTASKLSRELWQNKAKNQRKINFKRSKVYSLNLTSKHLPETLKIQNYLQGKLLRIIPTSLNSKLPSKFKMNILTEFQITKCT